MREQVEASQGCYFNHTASGSFYKIKKSNFLCFSVFQRFFMPARFSSTASKLFFACELNLPLRNTSLIKLTGSSAARWINRPDGVFLLPSSAAFTSLR